MTPTTPLTSPPPRPRPPWDRALVTAGTAFLGSHICERLLDLDVEVDCVDAPGSRTRDNVARLADRPGFRLLLLDLSDPGTPDALAGPYDLVLHLAAAEPPADGPPHPLRTLDAAGRGTRHVLTVADRDGARFLLASPGRAHGSRPPRPRPADLPAADPADPHSAHDESVRFSEALTTAYASDKGTDAGIVRVFPTHGPRMRAGDGGPVATFIERALAGEPLTLTGEGGRVHSLCYVDDMVDGVLLVAAGRSVRPVDIGDDETAVPEIDIARRVIELTGSASRLEFSDPEPASRPADGPDECGAPLPDTAFARELFGWAPKVPWEEGLKRTIAHFTDARPPRSSRAAGHERGEWSA
ncbi:NAD-dependent epimerase/dehydratase family protein [Streptomyces sp. NPDC008313]|uniref:NAD-dependent epimerase/dehydratase family protein n=1 Tax=Streptomyces sp. NPDC008313 TaxID=3364826 RepID=UPI0036E966C9